MGKVAIWDVLNLNHKHVEWEVTYTQEVRQTMRLNFSYMFASGNRDSHSRMRRAAIPKAPIHRHTQVALTGKG